MIDVYTLALLAVAFLILVCTLVAVVALHRYRSKSIQLSIDVNMSADLSALLVSPLGRCHMDNARNLILTAWLVFAMTGCDSATQSPHVEGSQLEALTLPQDFEGVSVLAVDPGGVIYAGDRRGRLSVSVDGGKTWSALIDSSTGPGGGSICEGWNCETRDLVADRMDPSRLFLRKVDSDWKRGGASSGLMTKVEHGLASARTGSSTERSRLLLLSPGSSISVLMRVCSRVWITEKPRAEC